MEYKHTRVLYNGRYLRLNEDTYITSSGKEKGYEYVSRQKQEQCPGEQHGADAVGIIVTDPTGDKILICKEFRMAVGDWVYNFPAGLIDPGESVEEAAIRELKEETGLELYEITYTLTPAITAAGFSTERVATIIGKAIGLFQPSHSEMEEIIPCWYSKKEARELLRQDVLMSLRTQSYLAVWSGYVNS